MFDGSSLCQQGVNAGMSQQDVPKAFATRWGQRTIKDHKRKNNARKQQYRKFKAANMGGKKKRKEAVGRKDRNVRKRRSSTEIR